MPKIMIVDDEPELIYIFKRIMEKAGYSVISAEGGMEGLDKVRQEKPDVVFLDIMMPDISGWDVLQKIKADMDLKDTKVFMLSIKRDEKDIEMSMDLGADKHLKKPIRQMEIINAVKELKG